MLIVFYISGHGFGHAVRSVELIKALVAARPDARIVVKTSAPAWLFETIPGNSVTLVPFQMTEFIKSGASMSCLVMKLGET